MRRLVHHIVRRIMHTLIRELRALAICRLQLRTDGFRRDRHAISTRGRFSKLMLRDAREIGHGNDSRRARLRLTHHELRTLNACFLNGAC